MLYERSVARARLKDYDGAIRDVNDALTDSKYKDSIKAIYHRACVHRYRGDLGASEADSRKVLVQQPDHAGAIRLLEQLASPNCAGSFLLLCAEISLAQQSIPSRALGPELFL